MVYEPSNREEALGLLLTIGLNYNGIPEKERNQRLRKILDKEYEGTGAKDRSIAELFFNMPQDLKDSFVYSALASNLPSGISELGQPEPMTEIASKRFNPSERSEIALKFNSDSEILKIGLRNVRDDLWLKAAYRALYLYDKDAATSLAEAIMQRYEELPQNITNLVFKLADNENTAGVIAQLLRKYKYDPAVPTYVKNDLLSILNDMK
ncbi:MAG: hypothetical protein M3044_13865 [Thermoproteota archaeon]|nr:hypothetical protein [Thermoproteota archaeon]